MFEGRPARMLAGMRVAGADRERPGMWRWAVPTITLDEGCQGVA